MLKCIVPILIFFPFSAIIAQPFSGTWNGVAEYTAGRSITTVMKKMGAAKKIELHIAPSGIVSGILNTTYNKSVASLITNDIDQTFVIGGLYDSIKKILLLTITHTKKEISDTAKGIPFKKPDSLYYAVSFKPIDNRWNMIGMADRRLNKNFSVEWIGSSNGDGMGMNISDAVNMHLLPLQIKLQNDSFIPLEKSMTTVHDTIAVRRKNIQHTILLDSNCITIDMYDNGEIDGDIATIILDGKTILQHQLLSDKAIHSSLSLSKEPVEHILELYADNLGSIPPNTALLVLTCMKKRYEINLSSDTAENGCVKLIFRQKQ